MAAGRWPSDDGHGWAQTFARFKPRTCGFGNGPRRRRTSDESDQRERGDPCASGDAGPLDREAQAKRSRRFGPVHLFADALRAELGAVTERTIGLVVGCNATWDIRRWLCRAATRIL